MSIFKLLSFQPKLEPLSEDRKWMDGRLHDVENTLQKFGKHKWHPYTEDLDKWRNRNHSCYKKSTMYLSNDSPITVEALKMAEVYQGRHYFEGDSAYAGCRKTLVGWVIEACEHFGLSGVTTMTGVHLMDHLFAVCDTVHNYVKADFQLLAVVCILLAAKSRESPEKVPSVDQLSALSAHAYSSDRIRTTELSTLPLLPNASNCVTPLCFLDVLSGEPVAHGWYVDNNANKIAILLLGLALQETEFTQVLPSILCSAAVAVSYEILRPHAESDNLWNSDLPNPLGYIPSELLPYSSALGRIYAAFVDARSPLDTPPTNANGKHR